MRRLYVDWEALTDLGSTFEEEVLKLEASRLIFENEVETIIECWTGNDSAVYQSQVLEYLGKLKYDVDYLYEWSIYFQRKARGYQGTEENSLQRLRSVMDQIEDDNDRLV
jgi:uncharacterized protein YukE